MVLPVAGGRKAFTLEGRGCRFTFLGRAALIAILPQVANTDSLSEVSTSTIPVSSLLLLLRFSGLDLLVTTVLGFLGSGFSLASRDVSGMC